MKTFNTAQISKELFDVIVKSVKNKGSLTVRMFVYDFSHKNNRWYSITTDEYLILV